MILCRFEKKYARDINKTGNIHFRLVPYSGNYLLLSRAARAAASAGEFFFVGGSAVYLAFELFIISFADCGSINTMVHLRDHSSSQEKREILFRKKNHPADKRQGGSGIKCCFPIITSR